MDFPSTDQIEKRIFQNNSLVLPDSVRGGIHRCLSASIEGIEKATSYLKDVYKGNYCDIPDVNYDIDGVIDAYTIHYLPRNFFVPHIIFRDLSLCKELVQFGETIRVLDVGSGTGAISLDIFDLFSRPPLKHYKIDLFAIDVSESALKRQACLRKESKLSFEGDRCRYKPMDLSDLSRVRKVLSVNGPWDIIISANFMVELDIEIQKELICIFSENLSEQGSLIISEPSQDRGKIIIHNIADILPTAGLTIYYPCEEVVLCKGKKSKCWIWRDYNIGYIKPITMDGKIIAFSDKNLSISTIILNKAGISLLEQFRAKEKKLFWGLISPITGIGYEICPSHRTFESLKRLERGSIVGWQDVDGEVKIKRHIKV
jgi:SAM-dependent methyltransferase